MREQNRKERPKRNCARPHLLLRAALLDGCDQFTRKQCHNSDQHVLRTVLRRCCNVKKKDAVKKELRKKLEAELHINLRDIFLIWSSTVLGVVMASVFESGITQFRTGFAIPEIFHAILDPIIFLAVFVGGAFVYTAMVLPVLRWFMIRFLVSVGADRYE
jgi:hypothetical protein